MLLRKYNETPHVFADPQGAIYAVTFDEDLLWYKDAHRNGTQGWAEGSGNRIGSGWLCMRHVSRAATGLSMPSGR